MSQPLKVRYLPFRSRTGQVRLHFITDAHLGTLACDEERLKADIQAVKDDEDAYWISGGDMIEAIDTNDRKRSDTAILSPWIDDPEAAVQIQSEKYLELFSPIADKCLGMVLGNHEDKARQYGNFSPYRFMVMGIGNAAGVKWHENELALGWGDYLMIRAKWGKKVRSLPLWVHHGYGGATSGLSGGPNLVLQRQLNWRPAADVIFMGHRHIKAYWPQPTERLTDKFVEVVERKAMFVPGYLKNQVHVPDNPIDPQVYSQEKATPPNVRGSMCVTWTPDKGTTEVTL